MRLSFKPDQKAGEKLAAWWRDLEGNPGKRADLKRCRTVSDVIMTPAFMRFYHKLKKDLPNCDVRGEQLAAVVGLVARIEKAETGDPLAKRMARPKGDSAVVSELRFRRLLQCDRNELYGALIRILNLLDKTADLHDLAESVYYWGDQVKKDWAYTYFPLAPEKKSA